MKITKDANHIGIYDRGGTFDFVANIVYNSGNASFPIEEAKTKDALVALVRSKDEYDHFVIIYHGLRGDTILSDVVVRK